MNNDNVFILKFLFLDKIVQKYCINEDVEDCIRLNNNHEYVKLIQDMNIGDKKNLQGQELMVELIYKGKNVKYAPKTCGALDKKISNVFEENSDLFINITKTDNILINKIYFLFYYKPSEKYIENTVSNLILKGLKKYPILDYYNNYEGYFNEFNKLKEIFKKKFIYKFAIKNDIMFCCVPSHSKSDINTNSIALMIQNLSKECNIIDGSQVLIRFKNTEAQKYVGKREKSTHLNSIYVSKNVVNKNILLIDDITTSGSSLLACKQLLMEAGANKVICYAFGKDS